MPLQSAPFPPAFIPGKTDALIVVDVQNDFLPDGALPVPKGHTIVPVISRLAHLPFGLIVTSQDWHPSDHVSFKTTHQNGLWPPHCVANTHGADFPQDLHLPEQTLNLFKGAQSYQDSYSAFGAKTLSSQSLDAVLKQHGITRVFVCGLALEYCVQATALDAQKAGYTTVLFTDATQGLEADPTPTLTACQAKGILLYSGLQLHIPSPTR
ncbi:isochorismatase family protein [Acetobacter pasteurianus]|uniref:isochorismatase family protein n=1 Tax=Acetobacter pasteurianus TaxID=438 RepID=UPI000F56A974|nr:isochorismatase family protein [Acetobacter pasteurianus]GCD56468.1 nicotinamidase [Acetobacter pasteurianus NBRC 3222]